MTKLFLGRYQKKVGQHPGAMILMAEKELHPSRISVISYTQDDFQHITDVPVNQLAAYRDSDSISWINVEGLADIDTLDAIRKIFDIHPLLMEDILNTATRPKAEIIGDRALIILKMLQAGESKSDVIQEQISVFFGKNWVLTFQERPGDVLDLLRKRIKTSQGRIRQVGADYLAYAITDLIVDHYFVVLELLGDRLEDLEAEIAENATEHMAGALHNVKRELIMVRRATWPLREALGLLMREGSDIFSPETYPYLRDVYEHTVQIADAGESLRDLSSSLLDIYLTSLSNRMNEVMKVLTIIATIFIPLTFIAGVYGMNFEFMPELKMPWAYPLVWVLFLVIAVGMAYFFKRRKWL